MKFKLSCITYLINVIFLSILHNIILILINLFNYNTNYYLISINSFNILFVLNINKLIIIYIILNYQINKPVILVIIFYRFIIYIVFGLTDTIEYLLFTEPVNANWNPYNTLIVTLVWWGAGDGNC